MSDWSGPTSSSGDGGGGDGGSTSVTHPPTNTHPREGAISPREVATVTDATNLPDPKSVAVYGNYAVVGNSSGGYSTWDVSDPTAPTNLGFLSGYTGGTHWAGGGVLLGGGGNIEAIDVSDMAAPAVINSYSSGLDDEYSVGHPHPQKPYWFIGTTSALYAFDVSDPSSPTQIGSLTGLNNSYPDGAAITSNDLLVMTPGNTDPGELVAYDVSDPTAMSEVSRIACPPQYGGSNFTARGTRVAVNDADTQVGVVDFADPANPVSYGAVTVPNVTGITPMVFGEQCLYVGEEYTPPYITAYRFDGQSLTQEWQTQASTGEYIYDMALNPTDQSLYVAVNSTSPNLAVFR
ncbi:LVIVD repeat-containing protein [Halomarina oriensis]|uniref:Choice-of-anchor B family protein n=1 Tax=Halomarina oriensis TaxID=671145 RepID=A0A6B0GH20_9EURY|nr:hypothetical protein [Halomarina oriensis]MWG34156.1 hypothetical protein [Halomarina oriensis]